MDRWTKLMSTQSGYVAERGADGHTATLTPRLTLKPAGDDAPAGDDWELAIQVPTEGVYTLLLAGRAFECVCRASPHSANAVHVDYELPHAPLRVPVAPGDEVFARLRVAWKTTRGEAREQTLFDGSFVVPAQPHKMGSPGYQVDLPHMGTHAYFCVGNIGTPEAHHLELLSFHTTVLTV